MKRANRVICRPRLPSACSRFDAIVGWNTRRSVISLCCLGEMPGHDGKACGGSINPMRKRLTRLVVVSAAFDVENDRIFSVDQIVSSIGEEGVPLVGAGPLRRRIRR
jgi:hypothetical protein